MPISPRKVQVLLFSLAMITLSALATQVTAASADSDCPPLQITPLHANATSQQPVFAMQPGRLRPQLESLLRRHLGIEHVVWLVAEEHEWPAYFDLTGATWEAILESLAASYQLRIQLHPNRTAVVNYLGPGEEGL